MTDESFVLCVMCGKSVPVSDLNRDKEWGVCRAEDRVREMIIF